VKLSVVSDTDFFVENGKTYLFHSVARELNILNLEIQYLLGKSVNENFKLLEPLNQKNINTAHLDFKRNLKSVISDFIKVKKVIKNSDVIHVRGPSPVMFYAAFLTIVYPHKKYWFKYANDWKQNEGSFIWKIQKLMLLMNTNVRVTINGNWMKIPNHVIPFENPCFYKSDILNRGRIIKSWESSKKIIFVGRMTKDKGIFRILDCLKNLAEEDFESMHFIGTGKDEIRFTELLNIHPYKHKIKWKAGISKDQVMQDLEKSHILFLPTSEPEGFPKVISEAWLNKCIPITSDISCIPQYVINGKTGFIHNYKSENWTEILKHVLYMNNNDYKLVSKEIEPMLDKFTYEYFAERILSEVLEVEK
jgi:glycosyltransferase involved in cell wall biosynthesis